jgi:hypothetical protein
MQANRVQNSTVLIVFVKNPSSIAPGAGDPRFTALWGAGRELQSRGHTVLVEVAAGLSIRPGLARRELRGFQWLTNRTLRRYGAPKLVISWFAYFADKGTRRNTLVTQILRDPSPVKLLYENGMTRGAVTLDPKGFLGDSYYVASLNARVQRDFEELACQAHIRAHVKRDISKRPQSKVTDLPAEVCASLLFCIPRHTAYTQPNCAVA